MVIMNRSALSVSAVPHHVRFAAEQTWAACLLASQIS